MISTNKIRFICSCSQGVSLTANALTAAQLADLKGHVEYEAPNRYLYDFIGTIYLGDHP